MIVPTERLRRLLDIAQQLGAKELESALQELVHIRNGGDWDDTTAKDPLDGKNWSITTGDQGRHFKIVINDDFIGDDALHVGMRIAAFVRRVRGR